MKSTTIRCIFLLAAVVALFHWKVLFTNQFSLVEDWEAVNQDYAWHQFSTTSVKNGTLPLWDPYAFSGRTHIGEMQAGVFYPLKLIFYLWPLEKSGVLSERLFNQYMVLARFLAACFIFFLARELGIKNRFGAFVAAICFGLGGFVGNAGGLQLLDGAIWLPLVLLFTLRALRLGRSARGALFAAIAGALIGVAILAGSIHLPMMDSIVVTTAAIFFVWRYSPPAATAGEARRQWIWAAAVVGLVGFVAFAAAGIQLLPAMEYAPLSFRWGSGPTLVKDSFASLTSGSFTPPRALFSFLFGAVGFPGMEFSPYIGVLPLFLAIAGTVIYWREPWVKYLAGLAVVAFFYAMGPFSFLYGILYLAPLLDKARESGRFIYLVHFSLALLAGFGVQALFSPQDDDSAFLPRLFRALGIVTLVVFAACGVASLYGKPDVNEWQFFSLLMLISTCGTVGYILRGNRTPAAQFFLAAIIVCDLYSFNWGQVNRMQEAKAGRDYMEQMMGPGRDLANFLHTLPGLFRVDFFADGRSYVNIGDMFGVQTTWGQAATSLLDYHLLTYSRAGQSLLNVRYHITDGGEQPGRLVYSKDKWKVFEAPSACPRAWIVSQIVVQPSVKEVLRRIDEPGFDPLRTAFVERPLDAALPDANQQHGEVTVSHYRQDGVEIDASVDQPSFLVLSEIYYPGWEASINGKPAKVYKTDGFLRGVELPGGHSHIAFQYRPHSVALGAALTLSAFLGVSILGVWITFRERKNCS